MRLLIVTQKVDKNDPILGFFHRWIEEFSKHCESVIVIGQSVNSRGVMHYTPTFPDNVTVLSLGKETGSWKITQILRYRLMLWKHRHNYDAIFVHMTPIWGVFAWRMVFFFHKPLYLWYEARGARWPLKIGVWLCTKVFSASKAGMPISTPKSVITGHGIDTELFSLGTESRDSHHLITVGRVTYSKRLNVVLAAFSKLSPLYRLSIYGPAITIEDHKLRQELNSFLLGLEKEHTLRGISGRVMWESVSNDEVLSHMQKAGLLLHASRTSLDKALLEAMSCGCLVVSCAEAARDVLPPECFSTPEEMTEKAKALLALPVEEQDAIRQKLRQTVIDHHSLQRLIPKLVKEMSA